MTEPSAPPDQTVTRGTFNCQSNDWRRNVLHIPAAVCPAGHVHSLCNAKMEVTKEILDKVESGELSKDDAFRARHGDDCACAPRDFWGSCQVCALAAELTQMTPEELEDNLPTCTHCGQKIIPGQEYDFVSTREGVEKDHVMLLSDEDAVLHHSGRDDCRKA